MTFTATFLLLSVTVAFGLGFLTALLTVWTWFAVFPKPKEIDEACDHEGKPGW